MTISEMRTLIRYRTGRHDLTSGDGLTMLDYAINQAYREIVRSFRFTETESLDTSQSTIANQAYISRPASWYAVYTIQDTTNNVNLRPYPGGWDRYEQVGVQGASAASRITHYVLAASRVYFSPKPSTALTLRALVALEPSELDDSNTTPVIPVSWHDGIVTLAVRNVYRSVDESEKADQIDRVEFPTFVRRNRRPRVVEDYRPRSRGIRPNLGIGDRRIGI